MHLACYRGYLNIVTFLIEKGCDKEACSDVIYMCMSMFYKILFQNDDRPIHYACDNGHFDIVKLLCDQGCQTEVYNNVTNRYFIKDNFTDWWIFSQKNLTPIDLAEKYEAFEIVEYLSERQYNTTDLINVNFWLLLLFDIIASLIYMQIIIENREVKKQRFVRIFIIYVIELSYFY